MENLIPLSLAFIVGCLVGTFIAAKLIINAIK